MENSLKKIIGLSARMNMPVVVYDPSSDQTGVVMHVDVFESIKKSESAPPHPSQHRQANSGFFPPFSNEPESLFEEDEVSFGQSFASQEPLFPSFVPEEDEAEEDEPIFFEEPVQ